MKVSKLYSWKNLKALTWSEKVVRVKVRRSHCHSHLNSRENHTNSTSSQEAKQRATAFTLTRAGTVPTHQNRALHYGPSETVHWGIFYLWAWRVLWATGCNCIHGQYKRLLEARTNRNFACSLWVMTRFYSLRSGTDGKTTDPFLLGTL